MAAFYTRQRYVGTYVRENRPRLVWPANSVRKRKAVDREIKLVIAGKKTPFGAAKRVIRLVRLAIFISVEDMVVTGRPTFRYYFFIKRVQESIVLPVFNYYTISHLRTCVKRFLIFRRALFFTYKC